MVPVLKQSNLLIASIESALGDTELTDMCRGILAEVGTHRARGVIIDVTGIDVLDSFAAQTLNGLAAGVRLRGARTTIVGIQPEVAFSMVQLGLHLENIMTALDLDEAIQQLRQGAWP